jgi:hypothetical protein
MAETVAAEPVEGHSSTNFTVEEIVEQTEESTDAQTALTRLSADGDNADGAPQKKTKKIIRRKRRPARPQVDPSTIKSEPPPQTGTIFNIWYNKWSGQYNLHSALIEYHQTEYIYI